MHDIVAAMDETAATTLVHDAETTLGTLSSSGSSGLGPFSITYGASASFSGGTVHLTPPDVVEIAGCSLGYTLNFSFSLNLNDFLPDFCLPQVCIDIPFIGTVCTPKICVSWPTISVPVAFSDAVLFTGDFRLYPHLVGGTWQIDVVIVGVPLLQLSPAAGALLSAIGLAIAAAAALVPFIGLFLAGVVLLITSTIAVAGVLGLLGAILTPFVSGLSFTVYKQPKLFQVLPAAGALDPAVRINLDAVAAEVLGSDKNELVVSVDISSP